MKNHPLKNPETGQIEWISRAVAVLAAVLGTDKNGVRYILAEQRGIGTPDPEYIGKWCLPCGYLDYNETTQQAIAREVLEETGINIHPANFELFYINDKPFSDKRQNVTFRFFTDLEGYIDDWELTDKFSESNEVSDIKWIDLREINNYQWAFNHEKIIKEIKDKI
jgi:8-oxo-dGTP pyrophosphatase MutT (NUDIX family)